MSHIGGTMKCKFCKNEVEKEEVYTDWYYCVHCKNNSPLEKSQKEKNKSEGYFKND